MKHDMALTDSERIAALIKMDLPYEVIVAARYLERFGLKFCVDYGTDNAVEKANKHFERLFKKAPKRVM